MAKMNGRTISDNNLDSLKEHEKKAVKEKLVSIFKAPTLLKRVGVFFYIWFICGLGLYGLAFTLKNLAGNLFMNNVYSMLVSMLRNIPIYGSRWTGRKSTTIFFLFFSALTLISNALITSFLLDKDIPHINVNHLNLAVFFIGRLGTATLFSFAYFWCSEVYPSSLRTSLGGLSSAMARVGNSLAPFLADMYKYVETPLGSGIRPLIMGITMVIGGFLAFLLPETKDSKVPETIAQANVFKTASDTVDLEESDELEDRMAETKSI